MGGGKYAVINYRGGEQGKVLGPTDADFTEGIVRIAERFHETDLVHFVAETRYHSHDYQADPKAQAIEAEMADRGGPEWASFLRDRRDAADAVAAKWAAKADPAAVAAVTAKQAEQQQEIMKSAVADEERL